VNGSGGSIIAPCCGGRDDGGRWVGKGTERSPRDAPMSGRANRQTVQPIAAIESAAPLARSIWIGGFAAATTMMFPAIRPATSASRKSSYFRKSEAISAPRRASSWWALPL